MFSTPFCALFAALLAAGALAQSPACDAVTSRIPCGEPNDGEAFCTAKKCCWNAGGANETACFFPSNGVALTHIHVVQSCHLDVGYAGFATEILNRWFTQFFPRAYALGLALDALGGHERLRFMAQSYVVSLYVDCPPGMGLACPTAAELANFTAAVKAGYITWHAFPFNGELELADEGMISAGVQMTWALDDAFGQPRKRVLSQRDVPGTTLGALPLLQRAGVSAISIGANGGVRPAAVPRVFMWHHAASGTSMPTLYHQGGYGGIALEDVVYVPGSSHGLVLDWRGDNAGPPMDVQEVQSDWAAMRAEFPQGVSIIASSFEEWAAAALTPATLSTLPVIDIEMGDTWVHGVSADSLKTAIWRGGSALRAQCLREGHCLSTDPALANFTRLFLKNAEHTWAHDSKSYPGDYTHWDNAALALARATLPSFFNATASYVEQRDYGIRWAIEALPVGSWLRTRMDAMVASLRPPPPPQPSTAGGYTRLALGQRVNAGRFSLAFGGGATQPAGITGLLDRVTGVEWGGGLGVPQYVTYTSEDFQDFIANYSILPSPAATWWFEADYGRPNMSALVPTWQHLDLLATAGELWVLNGTTSTTFLLSSAFEAGAARDYGAPAALWTAFDIPHGASGVIKVTLLAYGKQASRVGEGLFFQARAAPPGQWRVDKLGTPINPYSGIVENGNFHHHASLGGGVFTEVQGGHSFAYASTECALVNVGASVLLPSPFSPVTDTSLLSFYLQNNAWSTNYPLWYPFEEGDGDLQWHFSFSF